MSRSALLMVTESRSGKANSHSISPLTTPRIAGWPRGGAIWKWTLTMRAEFVRRRQPGSSSCAIQGGTPTITQSLAPSASARPVEVERNGAPALETDRPQAVAEAHRAAARGEKGERRIDEAAGEAHGRRSSGWQAFPPAARVSRSKAAASAAELSAGSVLSARVRSGRQSRS